MKIYLIMQTVQLPWKLAQILNYDYLAPQGASFSANPSKITKCLRSTQKENVWHFCLNSDCNNCLLKKLTNSFVWINKKLHWVTFSAFYFLKFIAILASVIIAIKLEIDWQTQDPLSGIFLVFQLHYTFSVHNVCSVVTGDTSVDKLKNKLSR